MSASGNNLPPDIINRKLPVKLTDAEVRAHETAIPQILVQVDAKEAELATITTRYKGEIKTLVREIAMRKEAAVSKVEHREVACQWRVRADKRELVRLDTNEVIETQGLTAREVVDLRQRKLFEESAEPIQAEETLAQLVTFLRSFDGKKVTLAEISQAFPEYREEALRATLAKLVDEGKVVVLVDGWRAEAPAPTATPDDKPKKKGKKGTAAPTLEPLLPPALPASGHPQQVLRGWIWARLSQTTGMTAEQLAAEAPAFPRESIDGTIALLAGTNLIFDPGDKGVWKALENESGRTIDQKILDDVAGALADGPLTCEQIAKAMATPVAVVWDVLDELRAAKRVTQRGKKWHLAAQVEPEGDASAAPELPAPSDAEIRAKVLEAIDGVEVPRLGLVVRTRLRFPTPLRPSDERISALIDALVNEGAIETEVADGEVVYRLAAGKGE